MGSSWGCELLPESRYVWRARNPGHTHRLICFPHAGAGASAFAGWAGLLPPGTELVAVQLPGRQNRVAEEPFSESGPLVTALLHALRPEFGGAFSFFGHSGGAALAYELTCALRARGRPGPEHLFLSAQPAPGTTGIRRLHHLPDDEFLAEVLALGGIDPELSGDPDAIALLLPLLRTDFGLWERDPPARKDPLECPVTVLCGESDPRAPLTSVTGWESATTGEFRIRVFPGGHFYFHDAAAEVVSFIGDTMLAATTGRRNA
ncbi:thioesterase II family protein [Sphaerisporangium aureirubrum]|uniref:Thioesterase II family protein n=1 Tax=Sphaerisporangium aureirubrum TaxID=1544736 RepID=A0ABW1NR18_9ACTN